MRRALALIFAIITVASCSSDKTTPDSGGEQMGAQTTLIYFAGTDLKSYYNKNIVDIKSAVASGALGSNGVLYYLLPSSSSEAVLYEVYESKGACVVNEKRSYSDFTSLSQSAIEQVIADFKELSGYNDVVDYPRDINLVVGSHGYGWRLKSSVTSSSSVWSTSSYGDISTHIIPTRYFGSSTDGYIDIEEFQGAIEATSTHFSYIIFDSCFMASLEALYRIRNLCDYVVASPCEVMATGFPYTTVLPEIFEADGCEYDLEGVCSAFHNYYTYDASSKYGCVSMCVTEELEPLASVVASMSLEDVSASSLQVYDGYSFFYDFGHFINLAGANDPMLESFNTQFDLAFPESCRLNTSSYYTNVGTSKGIKNITYYSGVTTSEPYTGTTMKEGWDEEPWAIAAQRVDF